MKRGARDEGGGGTGEQGRINRTKSLHHTLSSEILSRVIFEIVSIIKETIEKKEKKERVSISEYIQAKRKTFFFSFSSF